MAERSNNDNIVVTDAGAKPYLFPHLLPLLRSKGKKRKADGEANSEEECEFCGKMILLNKLQEHKNSHTGDKPYQCKYCNEKFAGITSRTNHVHSSHPDKYPFTCKKCGMSFKWISQRRAHMENQHANKPKYRYICKKEMPSQIAVEAHGRSLKTEVQWNCSPCGKTYETLGDYANHIKDHPKQPPNCPICNMQFIAFEMYEEHMRLHKQPAACSTLLCFRCEICGVLLPSKKKYEKHVEYHKKMPHYIQCWVCGRNFVSREMYISHLQMLHQIQMPLALNTNPEPAVSANQFDGYSSDLKLDRHSGDLKLDGYSSDLNLDGYSSDLKLDGYSSDLKLDEPFSDFLKNDILNNDFLNNSNNEIKTSGLAEEETTTMHWKCWACDGFFRDKSELENHTCKVLQEKKAFICGICGVSYDFSINLECHMSLHMDS